MSLLKLKKIKPMIQKDNGYYNTSLEIVKEFIQTVTIIDDKAQFSGNEYESYFDAGRIIKQFAEQGKICSVFKFTQKEDIDRIANISHKSDITILDWKMEPSESTNSEESDDEDETEEDNAVSKGFYALEILKKIISSEYNPLKLFVIYTDEVELNRIVDEIKKELNQLNSQIQTQDETPYSFSYKNIKVSIFGKEEVKTKAKHSTEIADRSYTYEELPEAVYDEFVNFTHGIVSNLFLKSVASIRANTYLLLNTFQRDIDPAFIAHKGLLPIPDDAHDHIIELIGSEIKCIIGGALHETTTKSLIEGFIDSLDENHLLDYTDNNGKQQKFSKDDFKSLLSNPKSKESLSNKTIKNLPEDLPKSIFKANAPSLTSDDVVKKANNSNIEFAKLTILKKRYLKFNEPILTLGVILKGTTVSGEDEYWICIQPKCDSLRISEDENMHHGRSFLFLNLSKVDVGGEIISNTNLRFKLNYDISKAKQYMFRPVKNGMILVRGEEPNKWFFLDSFGRRFEYICELKNDFAQNIANNFASKVSRVAVNHSEWLRLNASK
jgi:hypothetical protein